MTELEIRISQQLRDGAMSIVKQRGLDDDERLASVLQVFPEGARRLLHTSQWSVNTGLRVLAALGVSVSVEIASNT